MKNSQALAKPKAELTKKRAFPRTRSRRLSQGKARSREARLKKPGPLVRDRFLHTL
ncbi:Hydroxyacylglutathione hydrolase [Vulgatibacter incomptus]|uniref:Hydroxyacylglutathione hydrolase n=1 Tax=Vulgatibacter incomptus TaxID=1391653 RepID=A0A0K1PAJ8_9BACT|nr:Hydroxyacylglutathione hydrolase [Vulgatibacter incomptus]